MKVAFGTDEKTALTEAMIAALREKGHEIMIVADGCDWPEVGHAVGRAVAAGEADRGIVCCTTGTGVSIAANKEPGVRAALCTDAVTAEGARRWNDANVVALGLRLTSQAVALEILERFLNTPTDPSEGTLVAHVESAE